MIRACEGAKVFRFEKDRYLGLLQTIPQFGFFFSRNLAHRLHKTSSEAHQNIYALDLSGNLQNFDLLTIFQAITAMHQSGELNVKDSSNDLIGSFFFRGGRVEQAHFMHLLGIEAVWQGFLQSASEGTFTFQVMAEPSLPSTPEHLIRMENTSLLIEGVSRRDVYQAMPESLRAMVGRLSRKADPVVWTDRGTVPLEKQIWEMIAKRPQPLASLWRRLNYSALTFLETVKIMIETDVVELLPDEPVAPTTP
jgi:hypothetical protein